MTGAIDNGGAVAIKGFNYQKASIILVMINNYHRDNFSVIPEAEDDFQVHVDGKNIFIQVKGEKSITLSKLITKDIIKKNLYSGQDDDTRKIFVWDMGRNFKNDLIENKDGNIVSPLFRYSVGDSTRIISDLNLDISQQKRLNNQYIYITPFSNNLTEAIKRLFGEMVDQELHVNNETGRALLAELILMIDQKSEISVQDDNLDEKIISGEYLKNLFVRVEQFQMFDKVLNKLPHNGLKKEKIKQERTKILIGYQNIKIKTKRDCNSLDLENLSEQELVEQIIQIIRKYDKTLLNDNLINAIAIECLCELWEEEL
ncbi:hypothetical protein PT105_08120 [Erysipelothrix rhusiopathiae]|nr:hypothetical protein [Erysipelothrix rhusiopathiae]